VVDSLKALDPNRPIREATDLLHCREVTLWAVSDNSHRSKFGEI
jgi:hypothetical protein